MSIETWMERWRCKGAGIEKLDKLLKYSKTNLLPLAVMAGTWLAANLLVNPVGDFPLNDDFSYGRTVLNLHTLGKLQYDQWLSMTLLTQVLWGAGFCKLFSFSFTVLRISTLVLALGGLAAIYQLCRDLGQSPKIALLATLAVTFNPIFFSLSFTFMTDVPFFAFGAMSTLYYARALRSGKMKWVLWGSFFALAATFVRQQGLMFPLSFGVAWLFLGGLRPKSLAIAAWPLALHLLLFFAFSKWLETSQGLPDGYGDFGKLLRRLDWGIFQQMPLRVGAILAYTGGFLLPLVALLQPSVRFKFPTTFSEIAKLLFPVLAIIACAAVAWHKLPWGNMAYNFGIGPPLLKDGQYFLNTAPTLSDAAILLLKILAFTGAIGLFFVLKKYLPGKLHKADSQRSVMVFALTNMTIYLGFLMLDLHCFDRLFFPTAAVPAHLPFAKPTR